jgi:hypothetical protein
MGWRTDWLYRLIFHQVELIWQQAQKEGMDSESNDSPSYLLVREHGEAACEEAYCLQPIVRVWHYDATGLAVLPNNEIQKESLGSVSIRGMFYSSGLIDFHITEKRDRVVFTYVLGPRYGRGQVWEIKGQGASGKLVPAPNTVGWIA